MDIDYKQVGKVLNHIFATANKGSPDSVLSAFETYFRENEYLMIVGDKKASIIKKYINDKQPKVLVELGGFIGYSAIYMANIIKDIPSAHFYSVEFDPILVSVMEKVIRFAGLENKISVLNGDLKTVLPELTNIHKVNTIDLLFLDHVKTEYVNDFNLANNAKLFSPNSVIIADNVIVPGAPDYVEYLNNHPAFHSEIHEFLLEYGDKSHKDGIMVTTPKNP